MAKAGKSFIFYPEVDVEGSPVECIYLTDGECRAQPHSVKMVGRIEEMSYYKPDSQELKDRCRTHSFNVCARFKAYQDHLRAAGSKKE